MSDRGVAGARPVRVLMTAPSLDMLGGQSRQSALLREYLRDEPSVEITFLPVNPRLPGPLRRLQQIKYVRTVLTTLLFWLKLLFAAARCDVLHVYSASYYSYLLSAAPALVLGKLYGKKVILHYHSGEAEDHLRNWRTALPTVRLADAVVVPSGYLVDIFARFGVRARAIHNIIELDRFRYRERAPLRPVFLTSRLLEPLYNVGCVLRAFAVIQQSYPEARLTVAADGSQRGALEALSRELGLRRVEFVGAVSHERMAELYDAADVYLMAPDLDCIPSTVVECLAVGLPVVTTEAGGIPYIVTHGETCLMVPRDDHGAMAAAAVRLLEDPALAAGIARHGREHCRQFTWPLVKGEWLRLYHEVAAAREGSASRPRAVSAERDA
jgi:glycosyltransferase involved in cell wall biosynthesis